MSSFLNVFLVYMTVSCFVFADQAPNYSIYTIGGNSNGSPCYFPFIHRNKTFNSCFDMIFIDNYGESHSKICSTTPNMDRDNKWGFCLDYQLCHFPFKYKNIEYNDCISGVRSSRFCSTTYDYDVDKQWSYCPIVCVGLPEMKGGVDRLKSFASSTSSNKLLCTFQTYFSKDSLQPLRVFSQPPCNTLFKCKEAYHSHHKEIKCDIDGKFNSEALCLKT